MLPGEAIRTRLESEGLDVLVATSRQNVFYTSGLRSTTQELLGDNAFSIVVVDEEDPYLVLPGVDSTVLVDTDVPYESAETYGSFYIFGRENASSKDETVLELLSEHNHDDPLAALYAVLDPLVDEETSVAIEASGLDPDDWSEITSEVSANDVRRADPVLSDLRRTKTDEEIDRLRRSVEITEASIEAAIEQVESGMTERELANVFRREQSTRGGDPLFAVVAFGEHSAYPHAVPGDRTLEPGDLIRFDVGCTYENYASDIARTYAFRETDPTVSEKYRILNESMDVAIELLSEGKDTSEVYEEALEYVRTEGADLFESFDRNHYGHGIGIDVYDPPTINQDPSETKPGMVMCVEPPYYELGTGGLQVEDEILLTKDGVERFTDCPDELPIVE